MRRSYKKLTPAILKRIIAEEKQKLRKQRKIRENAKRKKAKVVQAKDYANTLEKKVDQLSYLKKRQKEKVRELKKIYEARKRLKKSLIKRL